MCIVRASELMLASWFHEKRAHLLFIGSGSPQVGKKIAEELGIFKRGARMLVDNSDESDVYRCLGAKRGIARTFTMRRWDNLLGLIRFPLEMLRGRIPTVQIPFLGRRKASTSSGDPFLQGALYVFDKKGTICYRLIEESPGYPRPDMQAIKRVIDDGTKFGVVSVRATAGPQHHLGTPMFVLFGFGLAMMVGMAYEGSRLFVRFRAA